MSVPEPSFRDRVYSIVAQIPYGRVMTYGDVAACAGQPLAARIVGQIAHFGSPDLSWHRVVNRFGGLASGYYGGRGGQKQMLEAEGCKVNDKFILENFDEKRWRP